MNGRSLIHSGAWPVAMLAAVSVWLWPLGVGGRMPVGGDVTAFQIGLMAEYQRALHAGRLPLWNANWGFGFPGLAESQMGVYYPPHVVLYRLLTLEAAYTASLVLHTWWAALGVFWCGRRMGLSRVAGAVAGFVWATCGFFVIHITHQWGYTCSSWMPWAWGLAWTLVRGVPTRRTWLALSAVLAIQILPGHFQLAFITQTTVLLIGAWSVIDDAIARMVRRGDSLGATGARSTRWGLLALMIAWLGAGFLAACQLRPTWDLAQRAETSRTFEYLSGFAQSPLHLVSYVAPGLFHKSPLWRPVAWDPLHTSPEECLGYVGLVSLWLALATVWRRWRADARVRVMAVLGLATLLLSMGPFVPGFEWLIRLPGFSFFRAPARWVAATMLALALLAGIGFDHVHEWVRVRGSLIRFVALAVVLPALCVGLFELALASTRGSGMSDIAATFERARALVPWKGDPPFREVMAQVRQPATNPITASALARRGIDANARLDRMRGSIYVDELWVSGALLGGLVGVAFLCTWRRGPGELVVEENDSESATSHVVRTGEASGTRPGVREIRDSRREFRLKTALVALTVVDLWMVGQMRDVDTGPIKSLVEQSPVLQRLAAETRPDKSRVVSSLGNLPMVAGVANVPAYRTLDIPVGQQAIGLAVRPLLGSSRDFAVLAGTQQTAAHVRLFPPSDFAAFEHLRLSRPRENNPIAFASVVDGALTQWLTGISDPLPGQCSFGVTTLPCEPRYEIAAFYAGPIRAAFVMPNVPQALAWRSPVPERVLIEGVNYDRRSGPDWYVELKQTPDPEWTGTWRNGQDIVQGDFESISADNPNGWSFIRVPGPGEWTLELRYEGRAAKAGLIASAVAWLLWVTLWFAPWRRWRARATESESRSHATEWNRNAASEQRRSMNRWKSVFRHD